MHDIFIRLHDILIRLHDLIIRLHDIIFRLHDIIIRLHEIIIRLHDITGGHVAHLYGSVPERFPPSNLNDLIMKNPGRRLLRPQRHS